MTKEELFNAFYTNNANFNPKTILIIMFAAALLGAFIISRIDVGFLIWILESR